MSYEILDEIAYTLTEYVYECNECGKEFENIKTCSVCGDDVCKECIGRLDICSLCTPLEEK